MASRGELVLKQLSHQRQQEGEACRQNVFLFYSKDYQTYLFSVSQIFFAILPEKALSIRFFL